MKPLQRYLFMGSGAPWTAPEQHPRKELSQKHFYLADDIAPLLARLEAAEKVCADVIEFGDWAEADSVKAWRALAKP